MRAEIRPRSDWESIDLGVGLTRSHLGRIAGGWMLSVYPLCLLILALFHQKVGWGIFLIWWLKPVFERVALHPLSRTLFGEDTSVSTSAAVLPRELWKNRWLVALGVGLTLLGMFTFAEGDPAWMTLYVLLVIGLAFVRSGLVRCLSMPVRYLEGLKGGEFRKRFQVLSARGGGGAVGLVFICMVIEFCLVVSQAWFVVSILPEGFDAGFEYFFIGLWEGTDPEIPMWAWVMLALFYLNAMSVVAWFYVGSGFGLYLNTRTISEGWDIELMFRRLGQRLGVIAVALFVAVGGGEVLGNEVAREVMADGDFEVKTRPIWEEDQKEIDWDANLDPPSGMEAFGQAFFWLVMIAAVGLLVWLIVKNVHAFGGKSDLVETEVKTVKTVAGLNVEQENLPKDLLAVAKGLWAEGNYQEALGLLYRGSIAWLVAGQVAEIEESDTEMDCLRRVQESGEVGSPSYFKLLTGAWMSQAYARRLPSEDTMDRLWRDWPYAERRTR